MRTATRADALTIVSHLQAVNAVNPRRENVEKWVDDRVIRMLDDGSGSIGVQWDTDPVYVDWISPPELTARQTGELLLDAAEEVVRRDPDRWKEDRGILIRGQGSEQRVKAVKRLLLPTFEIGPLEGNWYIEGPMLVLIKTLRAL